MGVPVVSSMETVRAGSLEDGTPVWLDREAILLALKICARVRHPQSRIVSIRNTLALERIRVSEPLLAELKDHPQIEVEGDPSAMPFDGEGNLLY